MSYGSWKGFFPALIFLCLSTVQAEIIQIDDPRAVPGIFSPFLSLRVDTEKGFVLSAQDNRKASWEGLFYLTKPEKIHLSLQSKGSITLSLSSAGSTLIRTMIRTNQWTQQIYPLALRAENTKLKIRLEWDGEEKGMVEAVGLQETCSAFDALTLYDKTPAWKSSAPKAHFPLGVNLEAHYLFQELNPKERLTILAQARQDGFNSIRLHRLKEYIQEETTPEDALVQVESFLNQMYKLGFSLYLDLHSGSVTPLKNEKQALFIEPSLQENLKQFIHTLSRIQIKGQPLFQSTLLQYLCLSSENSLFLEHNSEIIPVLQKAYLQWLQNHPFTSLNHFRQQVMGDFFTQFKTILTALGYQRTLFLSNYQTGGQDLEINQKAGSVDRHFYVDYPKFASNLIKVQNRVPSEEYPALSEEFLNMSTPEGVYLSEINLPWPNRYQHELIPLILALKQSRNIKGLWFYDYRLRSSDFHKGGIFGIQKFRSIIMQIPYLILAWDQPIEVEWKFGHLQLKGSGFLCTVTTGSGTALPETVWEWRGKKEFFRFEKGHLDTFDNMGLIQLQKGGEALEAHSLRFTH